MTRRDNMLFRMLARGLIVRRGRALTALVALAVAAAVTTAMLTLVVDFEAKMRGEFRSYGANLVVAASEGHSLPNDALSRIDALLGPSDVAAPFAYAIAQTPTGDPIVIAGTAFARVRRLDRWWAVTAWPEAPGQALLGTRAAQAVALTGQTFQLDFNGNKLTLAPAGTLRTGAAEDSRVYISLDEFQRWTGVGTQSIEIAASGTPEQIAQIAARLKQALPEADVRPVRQIVEAEARVLGKTRAALLAAIVLIIVTAALCVLATLTTWVLDRRRDFAIMKALGASERTVSGVFMAEAAALGILGAMVGFAVGLGAAEWIGRANFHAAVTPRWNVFPVVLAGSVVLALLSAVLPLSLLRRVQPAVLLKGE